VGVSRSICDAGTTNDGDEEVVILPEPLLQDSLTKEESGLQPLPISQTPSGLWYTHRTLIISPLIRLATQPQYAAEVQQQFARLGFIVERYLQFLEPLSDKSAPTSPSEPHLLTPQQSAALRDEIRQNLEILSNFLQFPERKSSSIAVSEVFNVLKPEEAARPIPNIPPVRDAPPELVVEGRLRSVETPEQRRRVPGKGIVFEAGRSRYDREYLQENPEQVANIILKTLKNDDPELSPAAEQVLQSIHVYAESLAKKKGASLSQIAREYKIPLANLSNYVRQGLVPVLYKARGTTYLANAVAQELVRDYQDAREMGTQPARLLRERREKYFPLEAQSPEAVKRPENIQAEKPPDRLVTPQEVIDTFHVPESTVWTWLANKKLQERGRLWLAAPGGRSSPLVSMNEAESLIKNRPQMGRPPKRTGK
jgi:hypothetical protein